MGRKTRYVAGAGLLAATLGTADLTVPRDDDGRFSREGMGRFERVAQSAALGDQQEPHRTLLPGYLMIYFGVAAYAGALAIGREEMLRGTYDPGE